MADPKSVSAAALEAIKVLGGRVDGLVNAAGTTERGILQRGLKLSPTLIMYFVRGCIVQRSSNKYSFFYFIVASQIDDIWTQIYFSLQNVSGLKTR